MWHGPMEMIYIAWIIAVDILNLFQNEIQLNSNILYPIQGFPQKFGVEGYSFSFWSKIKGFNIPVYIPLTTSKGNECKKSSRVPLYSALGKPLQYRPTFQEDILSF